MKKKWIEQKLLHLMKHSIHYNNNYIYVFFMYYSPIFVIDSVHVYIFYIYFFWKNIIDNALSWLYDVDVDAATDAVLDLINGKENDSWKENR